MYKEGFFGRKYQVIERPAGEKLDTWEQEKYHLKLFLFKSAARPLKCVFYARFIKLFFLPTMEQFCNRRGNLQRVVPTSERGLHKGQEIFGQETRYVKIIKLKGETSDASCF